MTPDIKIALLLSLLGRVLLPPEGEAVQGVKESQLAAVASKYEQQIPVNYVRWLSACNGSSAGPGGIFGVRTPAGAPDALDILDFHPDWANHGWIPVAGDGNGNYYVLDTSRKHIDRDAVYFVDTMADEGLTYIAASDLLIFLKFLLGRELGEERWPFNAEYVVGSDPDIMRVRDLNLLPWQG